MVAVGTPVEQISVTLPLDQSVHDHVARPVAAAVSRALASRPETASFRGRIEIVVDNGTVNPHDVAVSFRRRPEGQRRARS